MTNFELLKQEIKKAFPEDNLSYKELLILANELIDFFMLSAKSFKDVKSEK